MSEHVSEKGLYDDARARTFHVDRIERARELRCAAEARIPIRRGPSRRKTRARARLAQRKKSLERCVQVERGPDETVETQSAIFRITCVQRDAKQPRHGVRAAYHGQYEHCGFQIIAIGGGFALQQSRRERGFDRGDCRRPDFLERAHRYRVIAVVVLPVAVCAQIGGQRFGVVGRCARVLSRRRQCREHDRRHHRRSCQKACSVRIHRNPARTASRWTMGTDASNA